MHFPPFFYFSPKSYVLHRNYFLLHLYPTILFLFILASLRPLFNFFLWWFNKNFKKQKISWKLKEKKGNKVKCESLNLRGGKLRQTFFAWPYNYQKYRAHILHCKLHDLEKMGLKNHISTELFCINVYYHILFYIPFCIQFVQTETFSRVESFITIYIPVHN